MHVPLVCFPVYYAYKRCSIRRHRDAAAWRDTRPVADDLFNYYMVWVPANLLVFTVVPVPLRIGFIAARRSGGLRLVLPHAPASFIYCGRCCVSFYVPRRRVGGVKTGFFSFLLKQHGNASSRDSKKSTRDVFNRREDLGLMASRRRSV